MDINELESFKLSDAVKFHKELNPRLWQYNKLDSEVRDQLLLIAEDFVEYLGISNLKVKDVTISGSNAAYSYTPHSDLDLHVLVDFDELPNNEVYQELFTAKKTLYNDAHDITVHGVPVELYVQDINQPVQSLGEYSIVNDKWIRVPKKRRANFDQAATKLKYEKLGDLIELALQSKDPKRVNDTIALVKRYRKSGLDKTGEFGPENLAYKAVRKQGLVQALYDLKSHLHAEKLSIEEDTGSIADEIKSALGLKQFIVTEKGNDLYLDSIIVDKKDQGKGLGTKALKQLISYADQTGKRIILTPGLQNKTHGTTSRNRLVKFYKQFGFKENKGRSIDFAMGAGKMYRDPKGQLQEKEHKLLNKPTLSVPELAEKHGVSRMDIATQLDKGIKVELEHTRDRTVAREIALDHLAEDPKYYDKLAKVDLEEYNSPNLRVWKNPSPKSLYNLTNRSSHKRMRGMYYNGDTYWWDANDAIHADGAKELGIEYNYLNRLEAGIDSLSGNYRVGGDDGVPTNIIQRYDIEEEYLEEEQLDETAHESQLVNLISKRAAAEIFKMLRKKESTLANLIAPDMKRSNLQVWGISAEKLGVPYVNDPVLGSVLHHAKFRAAPYIDPVNRRRIASYDPNTHDIVVHYPAIVRDAKDLGYETEQYLAKIIAHELQHAVDNFKSKGKAFDTKKTAYATLPYEINARFQEALMNMTIEFDEARKRGKILNRKDLPRFVDGSLEHNSISQYLPKDGKRYKQLAKRAYKFFDAEFTNPKQEKPLSLGKRAINYILGKPTKEINESIAYHVTPTRNLQSIMKNGLRPQIGDRSSQLGGEVEGIFLFPSLSDVEAAVSSWLGDEFDEDEELSLLAVDITGLENNIVQGADYETIVNTPISPDRIKVDDTLLLEASGYIPSES